MSLPNNNAALSGVDPSLILLFVLIRLGVGLVVIIIPKFPEQLCFTSIFITPSSQALPKP
ncbi:MAG: hypothetical protein ABI067_10745 [Leifsonia sp.]